MNREYVENGFKIVGGLLAGVWVSWHPLVQLLVALAVIDVLTGLLTAIITKSLDSDISFRGMLRKAMMGLLVVAAELAGRQTGVPLGAVVAGFYCAHEGLSILENALAAGLPVPDQLKAAFAQLQPKRDV